MPHGEQSPSSVREPVPPQGQYPVYAGRASVPGNSLLGQGMPLRGLQMPETDVRPTGSLKESVMSVGSVATIFAGGCVVTGGLLESGPEGFDLKATPLAAIGDAIQTAAEYAGPGILVASAAGVAAFLATASGRSLWPLAVRGLAQDEGRSSIGNGPLSRVSYGWHNSRLRDAVKGTGVTVAAAVALSTAFMIQGEVAEGPNRSVETIIDGAQEAAPAGSTISFNWQTGTRHFMESSTIEATDVAKTVAALRDSRVPGVMSVIPFKADLAEVPTRDNPRQAGLVVSVKPEDGKPSSITPEVRPGATCKVIEDKCLLEANQAVVDPKEGLRLGDVTNIRGQQVEIVGFTKTPQSLMNRLVVFKGMSEEDTKHGYSGFVTVANSHEDAQNMLRQLDLSKEIYAQTPDELLGANREFWSQNGTPPVMLLVSTGLILAGSAFAALANLQRRRTWPQVATLRAIGATRLQVAGIQHSNIALTAAKAMIPAAVVAETAQVGINSIMTGFNGNVDFGELGGAAGLIYVVQLFLGMRWPRKDDLTDSMRG